MRILPQEEVYSSSTKRSSGKPRRQQTTGNPQLVKCEVELKAISRRLDQYAQCDLPDDDVLKLLQDTRTQVLSLRQVRHRQNKKAPRRRQRS